MSAIQTQIEKLKSMQESMDVLTDSLVVNPVAKESTIIAESQSIKDKIDNIKLPEIDTTELAKETTLNEVSNKLDNLNVEVDLSTVAKQGENQEATNSAIYEILQYIPNLKDNYSARFEKNDDGEDTWTMVLPMVAGVDGTTLII